MDDGDGVGPDQGLPQRSWADDILRPTGSIRAARSRTSLD
jgi:hypothetical protein